MKDSTGYILSELNRILNGTITVDGSIVKYYSVAMNPNDDEELYIKVAAADSNKVRNKTGSVRYESILIDCINYMPNGGVNEETVAELCSKVVTAILPDYNVTSINSNVDFNVVDVDDETIRSFQDKLDMGYKMRKQINLQIILNEN